MDGKEFSFELRRLAAFYETHPNLPVPSWMFDVTVFPSGGASGFAKAALELGTAEKSQDDSCVSVTRSFGKLVKLSIKAYRSEVCEKVKVGERPVEEKIVPAQPATEAKVIPAHVEDVYEWRCAPSLGELAAGEETVEAPAEAGHEVHF